ncbi:MAG TPA: hypothetical protein VK348_10300 [Planctomycetota bacterium]|nr:hypothetical protein [Planctomycetota bacterium]
MKLLRCVVFASVLLGLPACGGAGDHALADTRTPRPVSILIEVYDPVTNLPWQDLSVRIVEADNEWSGCTCSNPVEQWFLTDSSGQVLFDEFMLAEADVGFREDAAGFAVLHPRAREDQAVVVLEIDGVGFAPLFVDVQLSWDVPDVFVQVPFD